jgi:ribosomal protein L37AE/L43A
MYKKICRRCTRPSYSSTETGDWVCPTCKFDLSDQPFYDTSNYQNINKKVLPLKRKLEAYKNSMNS